MHVVGVDDVGPALEEHEHLVLALAGVRHVVQMDQHLPANIDMDRLGKFHLITLIIRPIGPY